MFLGNPKDVLDAQGGTEIVQMAQSKFQILEGKEHLAAVKLSDAGMIRWYAACCQTPLGNTLANVRVNFIGLIHNFLKQNQMDSDFGTSIAMVNTDTALGNSKPAQRGLPGVIVRFIWIVITSFLSGNYKHSALFSSSGLPYVEPEVLTTEELMELKKLV